ncbi:XRE family transcriptional regulator [Diaphorobacter sp. DS2]|uniref:helix-turn-helix domain-containing protein n=1 Tax=Rossellomorea sp. FS2 TaxID=3391447 RepID=UPI001073BC99|nr:XRE family transcriptional regulator [Diaphorobacter sp. DS2]
MAISFEPLHRTLHDKGITLNSMRDTVLNSRTIAKIYRNESVRLQTIDDICVHLNVPIEKVVAILTK